MVNVLKNSTALTKKEAALLKFTFLCLVTDGSKFLIMYIIFRMLSLTTEYLIVLAVLLSIRNFTGGIHLKHYISCLIFTISFVSGAIFLSSSLNISEEIQNITLLLTIPVIYLVGPVLSAGRPELDKTQIAHTKRITGSILLVYSLIFICMGTFPYRNLIYWVIIFQIVQLIAAKIIRSQQEPSNARQKL